MDPMSCEDLRGRAIRPADPARRPHGEHGAALIHEFIAAGEYGLALEELAGFLALAGTPITDPDRGVMLAPAQRMRMDDNVSRTLAFCPCQVAAPAGP